MADPTDDDEVAQLVATLVFSLGSHTHKQLDDCAVEFGLPIPPADPPEPGGNSLSKHQRLQRAVGLIQPEDYRRIIQRFLNGGVPPATRNQAQDTIWSAERWPEINERARREIAAALDEHAPIWEDYAGLTRLLDQLWVLQTEAEAWAERSALDDIEQHMIRNPEDWNTLDLFKRLDALNSSDRRFALFLEGLLSGSVNPDEQRQRNLAAALAGPLARASLTLVEGPAVGGYPTFAITPATGHARAPQLLLFASTASKPDLRLGEVLDREVELMDTDERVLRYDRPIAETGLRWSDLQSWWADEHGLSFDQAKQPLWQRLRAAIPESSPPQRALFDEYHLLYGQQDTFHAMLPEVWLQWDAVTKSARGEDAQLSQRMDFLMLLPHHRRVVLEVDGSQHYSSNGTPSPAVYSVTTRGDRNLRLARYEVYRFSGYELASPTRAEQTAREFFSRLLA